MDFSFVTVEKNLAEFLYDRGVQNVKFPREKTIRILPVKNKRIYRDFYNRFLICHGGEKT